MKTTLITRRCAVRAILFTALAQLQALSLDAAIPDNPNPLLKSWFTGNSGQYARIRTADDGPLLTTWRGQTEKVYADVQKIRFDNDYIYVTASGLASHAMGPWFLDGQHLRPFPNLPLDQAFTMKFPRSPRAPQAAHSNTLMGAIGMWVNGTAIYNMLDGFYYDRIGASTGQEISMPPVDRTDKDVWHRDAYVGEKATFDPAHFHQPRNGQYHAHIHPILLRWQLKDHVAFSPSSPNSEGQYIEDIGNPKHSPILGWAFDGYPIYGPYGYSDRMNPVSEVRRMVSGYVLRDGHYGTTDLNKTGRKSLPVWAQIVQGRQSLQLADNEIGPPANQPADTYGPCRGIPYSPGRYAEDWEYLGDLPSTSSALVKWDLDRYNGRYCVTPEFPKGTYAYFLTINSDGTPAFPYVLGPQYYGQPTGGSTGATPTDATTYFDNLATFKMSEPKVNVATSAGGSEVVLTWRSLEGGGAYGVYTSNDLQNWKPVTAPVMTQGSSTQVTVPASADGPRAFFKVEQESVPAR